MQIILMRHGEAEGFKISDNQRQLTDFGKQQAKQTAEYILGKYSPDVFLVSTFVRAQQTLKAFVDLSPKIPVGVLLDITPNSFPTDGINELAKFIQTQYPQANTVVVVCHMPIVSYMVSHLTTDSPTSYQFAEARVVECEYIEEYLGTQTDSFIPIQP